MQVKTNEKLKLNEVSRAAKIISDGGVVVFPTDTVYGIGCRFDNTAAIERIKKIKKSSQNFPVLVASIKDADKIAKLNSQFKVLAKKYWPGALTLVVKSKNGKTIGVRMPNSKTAISLIKKTKCPIIGSSANFHGKKSPAAFSGLDQELIKLVDFVLKGRCKNKEESTVIDTTVIPYKILRQGALKIR